MAKWGIPEDTGTEVERLAKALAEAETKIAQLTAENWRLRTAATFLKRSR